MTCFRQHFTNLRANGEAGISYQLLAASIFLVAGFAGPSSGASDLQEAVRRIPRRKICGVH